MDLRKQDVSGPLARAERALGVRLDPATEVRKRRSVGASTDRGTWVRIEARPAERIDGQGWNGIETSSVLHGIAKPEWLQGIAWKGDGVAWRADETEYIHAPTIKPGGILSENPKLPPAWWAEFNSSFGSLASQKTNRVALDQVAVTERINRVFPGEIDPTVPEWTVIHGDMAWANLTGPEFVILDWENWGMGPRGYDAACLWRESLAVPDLAERVRTERAADLDTRSGRISMLLACAAIVGAPPGYGGPLLEPARDHATRLLAELR